MSGREIFAKLGVCFWRDKKFLRAGLEAAGYWAAALAWLRDDETEDGILPFDMVGAPLSVGERVGTRMCERLASPEVALFSKRENGYELLRYVEMGNERKSDIVKRLAGGKARVERFRGNASGNDSVTRYTGVTPVRARSGSVSESGSDLGLEGVQGEPLVEPEVRPEPEPTVPRLAGMFGDERVWFQDAVRAESGQANFVAPPAFKCALLLEVLRATPKLTTAELARAWLIESVRAYVQATASQRTFWHLTPDAWARWVGEGSPSAGRLSAERPKTRAPPETTAQGTGPKGQQKTPHDAAWTKGVR